MPDARLDFDNAEVQAEACAWIAQLDAENLTSQDLEALKEWMSRSPMHQQELRNAAEVWGDLNVLTDLMDVIDSHHQTEKSLIKQRKVPFWRRPGLVGAALVLILVGTLGLLQLYISPQMPNQPILMSTLIGEQRTADLPDGSTVILNTNSVIEVDYQKDKRKIRLLSGEAIFDVEPDTDRPFTVYAGEGFVRAVGTVFSVKLIDDVINVAVSEGAVEVAPLTEHVISSAIKDSQVVTTGYVKSGHKAVLEDQTTRIIPLPLADIESELSWQNGVLTFSGEPLEQVVAEASRYTSLRISIGDPEIKSIRVGGIYPTTDIDTLFEALEAGFNVSVDRSDPDSVILTSALPIERN